MEWISVLNRQPPKRNCDLNSSSGFSIPIIITDGKEVWDDAIAHFNGVMFSKEVKVTYWIHRFGYDNDSYEVRNITHWMPLPEPPK